MTSPFRIGFSINITTPAEVIATPTVKNIVNQLDYAGDLVSLKRLPGETNVSYRDRLYDVLVHRPGPDYSGMQNAIARDLGFLRVPALQIDLKYDSAGDIVAPNPRVDVLANRIVLYSDWRPNGTAVVDKTIYIYQPDHEGYFVDDLVVAINTSQYFTATLYSGIRSNMHSSNLLRCTSDFIMSNDLISSTGKTDLTFDIIIQNSLLFDEASIFVSEVFGAPAISGEYYIDYKNGVIQTYDRPSGEAGCSYHFALFPLDVDYTPIQIFTLNDDDFIEELFDQTALASGDEISALPNAEGADIIHQLFEETEVFWGE